MAVVDTKRVARLPVLPTVRRAYGYVFAHLPALLAAIWVPLLLAVVLSYGVYLLKFQQLLEGPLDRQTTPGLIYGEAMLPLLLWPLAGSFAVTWHLFQLRGEQLTARFAMRLDGRVWRYIALAGMLCLSAWMLVLTPTIMVSMLIAAMTGPGAVWSYASYGIFSLAATVVGMVLARGLLVLPNIAMARRMPVADVLMGTRGSAVSILLGCLLAAAPVLGGLWAVPALQDAYRGQWSAPGLALLRTAGVAWSLVWSCVIVSYLSLAYGHFFDPAKAN
jgi:hypothetical protein